MRLVAVTATCAVVLAGCGSSTTPSGAGGNAPTASSTIATPSQAKRKPAATPKPKPVRPVKPIGQRIREAGGFQSPSGNLRCQFGTDFVSCVSLAPRSGVALATTGGAYETDVQVPVGPTLQFGQEHEQSGITCTMSPAGVRCEAATDNGFVLNRGELSIFGPDSPPEAEQPIPAAPTGGSGAYFDVGGGHWVSSSADGIVTLEDGSVWKVDGVGAIDSNLWLVTDDVVVVEDGYLGYQLVNTDEGETVEATFLSAG